MVESHPVLWMFDEQFKQFEYPYSRKGSFIMDEPTYTDNGERAIDKVVTWNYGLSEPS